MQPRIVVLLTLVRGAGGGSGTSKNRKTNTYLYYTYVRTYVQAYIHVENIIVGLRVHLE